MREELDELLRSSYCPYSNFAVAAIVVCNDGSKFCGVNVENASFGATICAERVAITAAVTAGYRKGEFRELHIKASSGKKVYPCFMCRQVLEEFFNDDDKIYCYSDNDVEILEKRELCVLPFGSDDL